MTPRTDFSHVGMCVSDLERSKRFYVEALGFTRAEKHSVGPEFDRLMELEKVSLRSQFLRRGEIAIELLSFESPRFVGPTGRRPMNHIGLTHISIRVDDVDEVASMVTDLGGMCYRDEDDDGLGRHQARFRLLH
jgi:catechol 2,3-dioxygenase-like lactoylglutathione lyase family enzyme